MRTKYCTNDLYSTMFYLVSIEIRNVKIFLHHSNSIEFCDHADKYFTLKTLEIQLFLSISTV